MPRVPILQDAEFIELWKTTGSATEIQKISGGNIRGIQRRRHALELKYNIKLESKNPNGSDPRPHRAPIVAYERYQLGILNGTILVFSDAHFWPGIRTTAFDGLLWAIKELKPQAVICNGDALDGASISRHPPSGIGPKEPTVIEELKACQSALGEIEEAAKEARYNVKLM